MFRSHRHSFGRTHTALGLLVAALLGTSVEAAAAPDPFLSMADSGSGGTSQWSATAAAATRLLGRLAPGATRPRGADAAHCVAQALTLIAGRFACDGVGEDSAPSAFAPDNLAATQGHRDVPHPQRAHASRRQTNTTE